MLGGGPGTLTVSSALDNQGGGSDVTELQVGWSVGNNDPLPKGIVRLSNANGFTGQAHVYGNLVLDNKDAASSAKAVNVYDGAMLDLAASGAGIAKVNMQPGGVPGGAIANTGGSLSAADVATLFPSYYSYILGSALTGNTTILDGALLDNAFGKNLWKVGANQVTLEDMGGEGEDVSHSGFFHRLVICWMA